MKKSERRKAEQKAALLAAVKAQQVIEKVAAMIWYYGPDFHLIHKFKNKLLRQAGIERKELTATVLRNAEAYCRDNLRAGLRPRRPPKCRVDPPFVYKPPKRVTSPPAKPSPVEEPLVYKGPAPEERTGGKTTRLYSLTEFTKNPLKLENAKSKTVYKWAEKLRDYWQIRGRLATTDYLRAAAEEQFPFMSPRGAKAVKWLTLIYEEEFRREQLMRQALVEQAAQAQTELTEKGPAKPREKGKDKWGYRLGTRAARVNAVLIDKGRSEAKLRKLAGETNSVSSHLSSLRKKKLIVRTKSGKYRLRKPK